MFIGFLCLNNHIPVAPLKLDQVRVESEPQNSSGSAFATGVVNGRDQITERQRLLLVMGLHQLRMSRNVA